MYHVCDRSVIRLRVLYFLNTAAIFRIIELGSFITATIYAQDTRSKDGFNTSVSQGLQRYVFLACLQISGPFVDLLHRLIKSMLLCESFEDLLYMLADRHIVIMCRTEARMQTIRRMSIHIF